MKKKCWRKNLKVYKVALKMYRNKKISAMSSAYWMSLVLPLNHCLSVFRQFLLIAKNEAMI